MEIKFENVRLSIGQTKNPMFFQVGIYIDEKKAKESSLSHGGMAFALVSKDELKALMGSGFKPFSLATVTGEFREEENIDPTKPTLLKFDILSFTFKGGMGSWEEILSAPAPVKASEETQGF